MGFLDSLNVDSAIMSVEEKENPNAHLELLISEIFNTKNIGIRTDLTSQQVLVFAKAQLYASKFNVSIIDSFLNNYMTLALSKNRTSRKELVDISKSFTPQESEISLQDRLLGK